MLSQDDLKSALRYSQKTGLFTWRVSRWRVRKGDVAGHTQPNGYVQIRYQQKCYLAHRLAFLYVKGAWPKETVDHKDGDPSNNRFSNLRTVSQRVNSENRRVESSYNQTGFLGVRRRVRVNGLVRFVAVVTVNYRATYVSTHLTPEEAHQAYLKAKRKLHKGCLI